MRIESLYIDGFGHFTQTEFGPFATPIAIFDGANEAGKTTLLAFVRAVLFGFPRLRRDAHFPPRRGGRHGGRIKIVDTSGTRYTVERYAGVRGGHLTIKDQDGTQYDATKLQQLVGYASPELFAKVFAFGLDELQDIKSLDDEEVQGRIYSAGLGVTDLPQVEKTLLDAQEKLYRPGGNLGRNQAVARVLGELQEVERGLAQHEPDAPRFAEITSRTAEITEELRLLDENRTRSNRKLDHQRKLVDGHEDLMEIVVLEEKLATLPQFPDFPEDGVTRLEDLLNRAGTLEEAAHQTTEAVGKAREVAERPLAGATLLEDAAAVRQAIAERSRLDAAVRDLPERIGEARQQESEVTQRLSDLGHVWDEARLEAFDTSLPVRDVVNQRKDQLSTLNQAVTNRQNGHEAAEREERAADDTEKQAAINLEQADRPTLDKVTMTQRRGASRAARNAVSRQSEARQQLAELQAAGAAGIGGATRMMAWTRAVALMALGLVVFTWAVTQDGSSPVVTGGALLIAAGLGVGIFSYRTRKRPGGITVQVEEAERKVADTVQELVDATTALGVDIIDSATLEILGENLDTASRQLTAWETLARDQQEAKQGVERRRQERERAANALTQAKEELGEARAGWQQWLRERELAETLSPDGVLELFSRVETARVSLSSLRHWQGRIAGIRRDIQEIGELVAPLAKKHGVSVEIDQSFTLIPAIDELSRRLEGAQRALQMQEANRQSLVEAEERLIQDKRRLEKAGEDVAGLLQLGGTDDPEEFRRRASVHRDRQWFEQDSEKRQTALRRLFGPDADLVALRVEIYGRTVVALQEGVQETEQALSEAESDRDALRDEAVRVDQELAALSTSAEASALRAQRENLREELHEIAGQWAKYSVALGMLRLARDRHERERQPRVVQEAAHFFSRVTQERYTGLRAPVGESTIIALASTGEEKRPGQLSRGTREQLYLALRFGFVREFSQHVAALPVIVDDALVNCDPQRAQAAAEGFTKLADTNQVLVFTCHPTLVEQFLKACPGAEVFTLGAHPDSWI